MLVQVGASSCRMSTKHSSCYNFLYTLVGKGQVPEAPASTAHIYHERQVKELCALHALNNLFQDPVAFTKPQLDSICHALSPDHLVNPHKSMLGLGNYDVNVLMAALQNKGYEAVWFDKRRDPWCIDLSQIVGFILNVPTELKLGFLPLPLNRKHWVAVRQLDGLYYNLDSKMEAPLALGKEEEVLGYLKEQLRSKDKQLFLVVSQEVAQARSWLKPRPPSSQHPNYPT
ncbi:JOSD1 [Cordylochernes scorpioides]|uniref:ubiquitinyl hydrolase 1 n=1 Tax=Cordylochernes scorpioides TaxID=51811 RepID=A0ABY6LCK6_9ARAC|nr:JOSD1 [Cordylochernes scorpioides]